MVPTPRVMLTTLLGSVPVTIYAGGGTMSQDTTQHAPGWYPDPQGGGGTRWWDGAQWSARTGPPPQGGAVVYEQPKRKRSWAKILLVVTLVFLAMIAGCVALVGQAAKDIEENDEAAWSDVETPRCAWEPGFERFRAVGSVTNGSSKRSDYVIEVKAVSEAGSQLDTSVAFVRTLDPGQSAQWEATFFGVGAGAGKATCQLVDVTRTASV